MVRKPEIDFPNAILRHWAVKMSSQVWKSVPPLINVQSSRDSTTSSLPYELWQVYIFKIPGSIGQEEKKEKTAVVPIDFFALVFICLWSSTL